MVYFFEPLSDRKPVIKAGGIVVRRTDNNIINNSIARIAKTGDLRAKQKQRVILPKSYEDDDAIWEVNKNL